TLDTRAVCVLVFHSEVVKDIAMFRGFAHFASAHTKSLYGRTAHDPVDDVEIVDVLLDNVIAGQPIEVEPVAHHPLHIGPVGLALLDPELFLAPVTLAADHLANRAVFETLNGFEIGGHMAALRSTNNSEPLFPGHLRGLDNVPHTDWIDRDRLLHED